MSTRKSLNNKKSLFILFPVTIGIWSYIGYQIYLARHDDGADFPVTTTIPETTATPIKKDSFAIFANYRDPFLSNLPDSKPNRSYQGNSSNMGQNKIKPQNTIQKPVLKDNSWPEIKYLGSVSNTSAQNKSVALISIAGNTYNLKAGEEVNGIKLISFTGDQADFKRGKEKKSIQK